MNKRTRSCFAVILLLTVAEVVAQSPPTLPAQLEFEVAVVKKNVSGNPGASFGSQPGGRIVVVNNTLRNIIRNTWNLQPFQIVGGPDWLDVDRWDITAKGAEGITAPQQLMLMMRALLADRFKLMTHNEARETPVFALVLARPDGKFGPKFRKSEADCAEVYAASERGTPPPPRPAGQSQCGNTNSSGTATSRTIRASGVRLADFARNLSGSTGRYVVDRTGLSGYFDIELTFAPDQVGAGGTDPSDVPSLFAAIQEQLGLKLESQRVPVDVLVIDSAQRPVDH